ncbi:MAG: hypothetical protein FWD39_01430 [Clostridiales bacterium]|nr:hypothetical protein [Clostridiales bacterium]
MSKNKPAVKAKDRRREVAIKKAKQRKILIISLCALVVLAVAVFSIYMAVQNGKVETYSADGQTVKLLEDGTFTANLAHLVSYEGTYTKTEVDGKIKVSFTVDEEVVVGWIENGALQLPGKWEDSCGGASNVLPKK